MEWTLERFGEAKAEEYEDALLERCRAVAAGAPPHGRPCSILVGGQVNTEDLLYVRAGSHYIVYRIERSGIVVLDVIHKRRNITRMMKALL